MELIIVARFHARAGSEEAVAHSLRNQIALVRKEPGCLFIGAYRAARDPRLFHLFSRWADEAAFEVHAALPATDRFVAQMQSLIDHPFEAVRSRSVE